MNITKYYDTTFSTIRDANTTDAGGALILGTTVSLSGQLGKLDLLSGSKILRNEKNEVLANYILFCAEIAILESDRVKITASVNSNLVNREMEIHSIDYTTLRGSNAHLEIYLLDRK